MKQKNLAKRILALGLTGSLMLGTAIPAFAEGEGMEAELKDGFRQHVTELVQMKSESGDMYSDAVWTSKAGTFPASYDLRDYGYVPGIRNQKSWGTCWGFAAIGASEISILSELGMTTEEFLQTYGKEMNLSEKHLAWFGTNHLPEDDESLDGQAGEGRYYVNEEEDGFSVHYNGGVMGFASTIFSAGMGPVWESLVPYLAADGTESTASDWSLPEDMRFITTFELENSSMLPSPAGRDENGGYVYNAMGTEAIKQELLAGRAVSFAYHADLAMDPEAERTIMTDQLRALGLPDDVIANILSGLDKATTDPDSITEEETMAVTIYVIMSMFDMSYEEACEMTESILANQEPETEPTPEELEEMERQMAEYEAQQAAEEQAALEAQLAAEANARSVAEQLGIDYDAYLESVERMEIAEEGVYINPDTYAQYTDNVYAPVSHAVVIVGWDDNYDVSNFPADHQPPANGAWIVRNSWGSSYGNDGYFYLSYYDQTITCPETFDYLSDGINHNMSYINIRAYDMMEAQSVDSVRMDEPTFMANVFPIDDECVLSSVSIMTAALNTSATVSVYLLNEDATSPVDGTMLDTVTAVYEFGGYHRIDLNQNYLIPAGSSISIVQLQRTDNAGGRQYTVPFTCSTTKAYLEVKNQIELNEDHQEKSWENAIVNEGESFIMLDQTWKDWANVLDDIYAEGGMFDFLTYDNFGMKAYLYPTDDLNAEHTFGEAVPYCGLGAQICEDCGYTIVEP